MKVCMIGATGHTGYVLSGLSERREVALAGIAPGSAGENVDGHCRQAASRLGYPVERYESYLHMLDRLKPDVAAVACHFNDHAAVTLEALARGIHVFVEKPVALTFEDLNKIKAAYRKAGVHLAAMLGMRCESSFQTAKKAIEDGRIGKIRLMHAQKSYKLGERGELFRKRETYGGTIPWVGSHAIDWMYWLSGASFRSVFASHSVQHNRNHGELETTAACHFTFEEQIFGSVSIDYLRPSQAAGHGDDRIRIAGTEGILEVREGKVFLTNDEAQGTRELPLLPGKEIFADFLDGIRSGKTGQVSAEDSFAITEACLNARLSADEGRLVLF